MKAQNFFDRRFISESERELISDALTDREMPDESLITLLILFGLSHRKPIPLGLRELISEGELALVIHRDRSSVKRALSWLTKRNYIEKHTTGIHKGYKVKDEYDHLLSDCPF